ncbi:bacitracin ABC transporter permease [Staphylococcus cohnii]|uniref:FtsX-like permease family protein n=1 Tax=Staphylococcus TaxID=1279 RepID=UPI0007D9368A|nr:MULTISPECIES: FtsX-like permease family protein [Staphylococcus]OAO21790.1 bacitracin ABC transporter permease [Staphylococcus cohnii]PTF06887.1 bacitracin ABC transporter permease [Staphylococcus cohnii]PTF42915.1 bacitracin ABC transporter permease [Staphylococcus cohnii]RIM48468.1 FtsX-like permease family protein [Staphylococcus cohnii]HJG67324.1 ABC transporter permease [Staphylococcus ureilyticus]
MNFNQIVIKNLRKNVRHYAMYLFSLIVSIVLYFSFVTLKYTNSINNEQSLKTIQKGSEIGAVFLFFIIVIFLMYANQLFIKRRTREFALYQLIGLTRNNIMRMLVIEQALMLLLTGVIGMIIGIFGSKLLLMIVLKILDINMSVSLSFQLPAVIQTLMLIMVSFVLILIQSFIFLRKRSILMMMNDNARTEATKSQITVIEVIFGVLGIVMIGVGYYISTEMFGKFLNMVIYSPFIILFLTVLGAYLFFRSSVSLIFKTLKRSKKGNVSITDVVFTSSIMHRMKKNALSLTIIATISAVTVTVLCFGAISKSTMDENTKLMAPHDLNFKDSKQAKQFESKLQKAHIEVKKDYKEVTRDDILNDQVFQKSNMGNMKTLFVTSNQYFNDKAVSGNKAKLINLAAGSGIVKYDLNKEIQLKNSHTETFKVIGDSNKATFMSEVSYGGPVLLVSSDKYEQIKQEGKETNKQYGYDLKHHTDLTKATKIAQSIEPSIQSQGMIKQEMNESVGILLFVTSFLGLAFLVAAGCIIYIKQMDETEDEIPNFRILRKIGYTHQDMLKGLGLKVIFNFGLPLVVSLMHAYFAAKAFMGIYNATSMTPVYVVMIVYSIVYCIFAIMSFIHSSRIVKHSI